jgi:hypothetical protein
VRIGRATRVFLAVAFVWLLAVGLGPVTPSDYTDTGSPCLSWGSTPHGDRCGDVFSATVSSNG